ncbi:MAG: bifunctional hydroxymethylpyrimidine kinase/phosphomethylpyrimidine kinase [Lachnospiraceae bacterium]|nr:bifunctional hydroxymethylpyrimidine kinase/phosphomethylpyrimidine kinase [Lachnospiraceae bacterium]
MKVNKEHLRLYAVTDRRWLGEGQALAQQVDAAIEGGVTFVQLREKNLKANELLAEAAALKEICSRRGVPLIINDNIAVAIASGADGVHIGQHDGDVAEARRLLGPDRILGVSAATVAEAIAAEAAGADYLGCGALFTTDTKDNTRPVTPELLSEITAAVSIPVVAIGGITASNAPVLRNTGIAGIAVVSALFAQPDITAAAQTLRAIVGEITRGENTDFPTGVTNATDAPVATAAGTANCPGAPRPHIPAVLTVAGSDSVGGAGIQADIKTITMLGCYAMSAITAVTAQNTLGVSGIYDIPPEGITAQLDAVFTDVVPEAVKIGMVSRTEAIHAIAESLRRYRPEHIVLDPVMVSTSGHALLAPDAADALCTELLPLATIITPNIPETTALLGRPVTSLSEMKSAALELSARYGVAVLVKGGHLTESCEDVLAFDGEICIFRGEHIETTNTHGTGCTLSSAIASHLALGHALPKSIRLAKDYLTGALRTGFDIGKGNGPLLHNYRITDYEG